MSIVGSMSFDDIDAVIKHDDSGGHETVAGLDFTDIAHQDVNDPVWPSEPLDYGSSQQAGRHGHAHEGVRTVSGLIDLMTDVRDELHEWIERESDGPGHRPHRKHDKPITVATYVRAAKSCRCNSFNIDQGKRILERRADRTRAVITNWSSGIVYLTHQSDAAAALPESNMVQVAPNASRTFYMTGELWAYPAVNGTAQLIDVQDEYGRPEDDY